MKKLVLLVALTMCFFTATSSFAENISSDNVSVYSLKRVLSSKYGCRISEYGNLIVTKGDDSLIIKVLPKIEMIRIWSGFSSYDKRSTAEMIHLANKFNDEKIFLRVSVDPEDGSSVCEYYMTYAADLNSDSLDETIKIFFVLKKSWNEFVINGGDK